MKEIKILEQAKNEGNEFFRNHGINLTLFWAYRNSQRVGNELIDFSDAIWEADIEPTVTLLRNEGIREFTISSSFSSLITILAAFEKHGCTMNGLTEVNATYTDITTGEFQRIPAIRMILN